MFGYFHILLFVFIFEFLAIELLSAVVTVINGSRSVFPVRNKLMMNASTIDVGRVATLHFEESETKAEVETIPILSTNVDASSSDISVAEEKVSKKRKKTKTKDPERLANINAAIDFLLETHGRSKNAIGMKYVARKFNIPYNTFRDNFIRL